MNRRRVLVIEPAAVDANVFAAYGGLPLLGPLYLGTLLRRAGFEVRVVTENLLGRRLDAGDLDADFLLVTGLTSTIERGYELADLFRRRYPEGKVVMGGPHVSFMTAEALRHADWVVTGEAENVIVDLLRHGSAERVIHGTPVADLDALPLADWGLLANAGRRRIDTLMFSRGCPFACNFCSVTAMFGRRYRAMSAERVLAEMERVTLPEVFVYDDNFAAVRRRTHDIADGLLRRRRAYTFSAQVRTDLARDEELVAKLARAGCSRVYVGFESVNDRALAEMKKGQTADDVRRAVRAFHRHGIRVHGMFIFGADADDAETLRATAEFVRAERIDSVQYMVFTPFPGTEVYRRLASEGRLLHKRWPYYDAMHVVFRPRRFSPFELQAAAMETYGDYYNVLQAVNDGLQTAGQAVVRLAAVAGRALGLPIRKAAMKPSVWDAGIKVMGTRIVARWWETNAGYMEYLRTA